MDESLSSRRVSWSPKASIRRRVTHDGSFDYQRIGLGELTDFKDLQESENLARGGSTALYGAVWTREDGSKKEVAAKRLNKLEDKEAEILSGIRHKNIIRFFGAVIEPPQNFYIVMELYTGAILFDYIHQQTLEICEAHELALGIADGMHYLHYQAPDAPIRHNNLCSGKIFLHQRDSKRIPKIGGFGNSQLHSATQYTKSQGRIQLQGWMPPEAVEGKGVNLKSDVYSFGIVLWELLTGEIPYNGKMLFETLMLIVDGKHPEIPSDCPDDWRQLLTDCWALDKEKRPTFRSILNQLESFTFNVTRPDLICDAEACLLDRMDREELDTSQFTQPFKWQLPSADYAMVELGETTYSGRLSFIRKSMYNKREVAARVIIESEVKQVNFEHYMNTISQINHKNVVQLIGGFLAPKMLALFEWMPVVLQNICPVVDEDQFIAIAKDVAEGLAYLHTLKPNYVIHGSLSSRTVLMNAERTVAKVTDFNYYSLNDAPMFLSRFPDYVDPYAKRNNFRFDMKSDVYSFGVLLVEMAYGQASKLHEALVYIRESWPALANLASVCCMKRPNERPTMTAILKDRRIAKLEQ